VGGLHAKVVEYGADWALEFMGTKENVHVIVFDNKNIALYTCALVNDLHCTLDIAF
jgi:hypothetical protein